MVFCWMLMMFDPFFFASTFYSVSLNTCFFLENVYVVAIITCITTLSLALAWIIWKKKNTHKIQPKPNSIYSIIWEYLTLEFFNSISVSGNWFDVKHSLCSHDSFGIHVQKKKIIKINYEAKQCKYEAHFKQCQFSRTFTFNLK